MLYVRYARVVYFKRAQFTHTHTLASVGVSARAHMLELVLSCVCFVCSGKTKSIIPSGDTSTTTTRSVWKFGGTCAPYRKTRHAVAATAARECRARHSVPPIPGIDERKTSKAGRARFPAKCCVHIRTMLRVDWKCYYGLVNGTICLRKCGNSIHMQSWRILEEIQRSGKYTQFLFQTSSFGHLFDLFGY